jgi:FHA domain
MSIGFVCGSCSTFVEWNRTSCSACGVAIQLATNDAAASSSGRLPEMLGTKPLGFNAEPSPLGAAVEPAIKVQPVAVPLPSSDGDRITVEGPPTFSDDDRPTTEGLLPFRSSVSERPGPESGPLVPKKPPMVRRMTRDISLQNTGIPIASGTVNQSGSRESGQRSAVDAMRDSIPRSTRASGQSLSVAGTPAAAGPALPAVPGNPSEVGDRSSSSLRSLGEGLRPRASLSPFPRARKSGQQASAEDRPSPVTGARRLSGASAARSSLEELMDQAKNYVCKSCSTPVPMGHRFCGRCGATVPPEIVAARTQYFGQLQESGKAKLILIRGEGIEGLSYQLNAEHHLVGQKGQLVFPDDPYVSPRHADLFYRDSALFVKDEGSLNGIYIRVRGTIPIEPNTFFMAGEQLFCFEPAQKATDSPAPDGTYFYSSPKHQTPFQVSQILQGGATGMTVCAGSNGLQIGREGGDINFPMDIYMSASHCKIEEAGPGYTLTDLNSRNGTYVRIAGERKLEHGDYLFIGRKLLRVEINAA